MFSLVSRSSGFYRRVDSIGDERSTHFRSFINSFLCIFVHTSSCTLRSSHYTILQVNSLQPFFLPHSELFRKNGVFLDLYSLTQNAFSNWHTLILTLLARLTQFCTHDFITSYCFLRMHTLDFFQPIQIITCLSRSIR